MSDETEGGNPIADTGDCTEIVCPVCVIDGSFQEVEECSTDEVEDYRENREPWLIYSIKWTKGIAIWWGPKESGYAQDLAEAGRYSRKEVLRIERLGRDHAVGVPEKQVKQFKSRTIIDVADIPESIRQPEVAP